jgi:hypothetical protein
MASATVSEFGSEALIVDRLLDKSSRLEGKLMTVVAHLVGWLPCLCGEECDALSSSLCL